MEIRRKNKEYYANMTEKFEISASHGGSSKYIVKKRPFVDKFLEEISEYFDIYVYTFGTKDYALSVFKNIDSEEKYLKKSR